VTESGGARRRLNAAPETCTPARLGARDIGGGRRPGESCERGHFIGAFGHEAKTGELILLATPVAVMTEAQEAFCDGMGLREREGRSFW